MSDKVMNINKIELCPYCGSDPEFNEGLLGSISVICSNNDCCAHYFHPMYKNKEEAINKWNRRYDKLVYRLDKNYNFIKDY